MSLSSSTTNTKTAKLFLAIHFVVFTVCTALAFLLLEAQEAKAFLLGEGLLMVSLLSLALAIYFGMIVKKILLAVGVIVFKWPLLIYIVLQSVNAGPMPFIYVSGGLSTWLLTAVILAVIEKTE